MLSETWLSTDIDTAILSLDGYNIYRKDRQNQRGGGVCICIKNQVDGHSLICSTSQDFNTTNPVDGLWLDIQIDKIKIHVACIYRPGNTTSEEANTQMIAAIKESYSKKNPTFILGDFNYPNINWDNLTVSPPDKKTQDFMDMYQETNSHQIINFSTETIKALYWIYFYATIVKVFLT